MAVVLAFRIMIALAPTGVKVVEWSAGPGVAHLPQWLQRRLHDPAIPDATLSSEVSAAIGRLASVTTWDTTFELRKLHIVMGRTSGAASPEDDAIITMHFVKLAAGVPTAEWLTADFTTIESAFDTFWATFKLSQRNTLTFKQFRWYATGPQIDEALGAPGRTGPPRRVVDRSVPGTGASGGSNDTVPQVAVTLTERTSDKKAWGRIYLPAPQTGHFGAAGRILTAWLTTVGNAADTFYEACAAAGTPIVVYSAAKPERPTAGGGTLPARPARALTVDQIQLDDLADVLRSRRWDTALLRLQRDIAGV